MKSLVRVRVTRGMMLNVAAEIVCGLSPWGANRAATSVRQVLGGHRLLITVSAGADPPPRLVAMLAAWRRANEIASGVSPIGILCRIDEWRGKLVMALAAGRDFAAL